MILVLTNMHKRISLIACLALYLVNQPVLAESRQPYADAHALQNIEPEEQRVWSSSLDFEKAIKKGGQIYASPELEVYLQEVMDKLYPEFKGSIKVHVVDSPVLNAFAIPNGNIYMHTGILARFENESQLATVLAHEGAHFVYRHGYYNQQSLKSSTGFATITAVLGVPVIALVGNIVAASSIFGYSRELETEADNIGFQRLIDAGYDPKEARKVFEHLAAEVKLSEIEESVFYSTHPKLQDRIENFTKLAQQHAFNGDAGIEEYQKHIAQVLMHDLDAQLSFGRYKHIIALLSDDKTRARYPATVSYYLGEAYRKRNAQGDMELAVRYLDEAIKANPEFAHTYRAKGLLLMSQHQNKQAIESFKKYLELVPNAPDKSYVQDYLESLNTAQPSSSQ